MYTRKSSGLLAITVLVMLFCGTAYAQSSSLLQDKQSLNVIDRMCMFPYSAGLDAASDYTQYAAFLTPAIFLFAAPSSDWTEIGLMYAGSSVLAYGSGYLLKSAIPRDRPYMYYDNPPQKFIDNGDYKKSFPSNHSVMAFTGAGFTAAVFQFQYPDSPYRIPAVATAYSLAFATAALRVGSGSHFLSDVTAGALIGTFSGFIVPYVNFRIKKSHVSLSASVDQLSFNYRY